MKKFTKLFSILILAVVCSFSFIACKNNENKQAAPITTSNISDTGSNNEDDVAENVSDETQENLTIEESQEQEIVYPITPGIYKFQKETLTFDDIYYKDEAELLNFFETRDLNGVFDFVYKVGFADFAKSITIVNIGGVDYKKVVNFNKNESNDTELGYVTLFESYEDTFTLVDEQIVYDVVDGNIVLQVSNPEFIINQETNTITILYPFSYINAETTEIVNTPLYIKVDVTLYNEFDIMQDNTLTGYTYLDGSAKIINESDYLTTDEAMKKLTEMLPLDKDAFVEDLENIELYVKDNKDLYIQYYEDTVLITDKIDNVNEYLLFNTVKIEVVNEYYDLTLGLNVLTAQIEIDENVYFRCNFVA